MRSTQDIPRLSWQNGRTYRQQSGGRSGRSGHKQEHIEALREDASRTLAVEIEKALTPLTPENHDGLVEGKPEGSGLHDAGDVRPAVV